MDPPRWRGTSLDLPYALALLLGYGHIQLDFFFLLSLSLVIISSSHGCYLCSWQPVSLLFFFKYKYELSRRRRLKMTICIKNSHFLFFLHRALEHYLLTCYFNGLQSYHLFYLCFFSVLILCHFKGFEISPVWSL